MGTPVSKSDDTVAGSSDGIENELRNSPKTRSPTPNDTDNVSAHASSADDDDPISNDEIIDMYARLTPNNTENDPVMNTKFDRKSLQSLPTMEVIVEKDLFSPNGRICSANGRVTARFISAEMLSADNKLKTMDSSTEVPVDSNLDKILVPYDQQDGYDINSTKPLISRIIDEDEEIHENGDTADLDDECKLGLESTQLSKQGNLSIPTIQREDVHSPKPKSPSCEGPVECFLIPRKRLLSLGNVSVISGIESLKDTYHLFYEDIQLSMKKQGFFDNVPSPTLIKEAQEWYKTLELPIPTDEESNPVPHPPISSVQEIKVSTQTGKMIDSIQKMPMNLKMNGKPGDITHYLCKGISDETNKLHAIITFVVYQQLETVAENDEDGITESSLKWCKVIRTFCKFCKIKTTIIKGIIREPMCTSNTDSSWEQKFWMAALVKKSWILIDPVVSSAEENNNENVVQREHLSKCVENCFQEPTQFIFSHYPDNEIWQLLARSVSKEELHELVLTHSGFFEYEMKLLTHCTYNISTTSNDLLVSLGYEMTKNLQFKCSFIISDNSLTPSDTRKFVFLESVLLDHRVHLRIRFPKNGSYFLQLFGSSFEEKWRAIVTYRITYEGGETSQPFPNNPREEWGPGLVARSLGLESVMYHSGEIVTRKGVLQIAFKDRHCLHFESQVHAVDIINVDYLKVSFLKDRKQNVIFVVEIDTKVTGTFMLQLMARKPDSKEEFQNFCNYFVRKEKSSNIPVLKFDVKESIVPKEIIHANQNGTLQFIVDAASFSNITTELQLHGKQEIECNDHVRIWIEDNQAHIDLNFPRAGKYRFVARGQKNTGHSVVIKEETIEVTRPSEKWSCFPKVLVWWDVFYKIEEPLTHYLTEKRLVTFRVHLINAQDVAIVGPGGWNHLIMGNKKGMWVGQVWTGPKSTVCRLQARFEVGSDKWSELLWYKVISFDDYRRMDENQKSVRENVERENTPGMDA